MRAYAIEALGLFIFNCNSLSPYQPRSFITKTNTSLTVYFANRHPDDVVRPQIRNEVSFLDFAILRENRQVILLLRAYLI